MSRLTWIMLLLCFALASGCATQEKDKPHVLSGEAPVEDVVAKGDESF